MSRHSETVLTHRGQLLHKYIKSFIVLDPKFIASRKIKIGDTVTGHVVFTNKKTLSCRGIHVTLMGRSSLQATHAYHAHQAFQSIGTDFLIKDGKTQNGIPIAVNAISKGTYKFPFSLIIADSAMMIPSFQFSYAEMHYEIQTIIVLKTGSIYKASSMPVKISDYVNIRTAIEFSSPVRHWIEGNFSIFNPSGKNNIRILLESPRSAYSLEEEMPISLEFHEGDYQSKIKTIKLSLVKKNFHSIATRTQVEDETLVVSKTINEITKYTTEVLNIPIGLSQSYDFVCIGKWEGLGTIGEVFRVTLSYFLKVTITPNGFGASLSDQIPIVIGTDNVAITASCLNAASFTRSLGNRCVWSSCDTGSQVSLLPAYSELSFNSSGRRRRDSTTSFETLPPTFEEALNLQDPKE